MEYTQKQIEQAKRCYNAMMRIHTLADYDVEIMGRNEASSDILAPIKEMRKLGEFGKWLNTAGNPFRKQHFNKKYTVEAVNEFLKSI